MAVWILQTGRVPCNWETEYSELLACQTLRKRCCVLWFHFIYFVLIGSSQPHIKKHAGRRGFLTSLHLCKDSARSTRTKKLTKSLPRKWFPKSMQTILEDEDTQQQFIFYFSPVSANISTETALSSTLTTVQRDGFLCDWKRWPYLWLSLSDSSWCLPLFILKSWAIRQHRLLVLLFPTP